MDLWVYLEGVLYLQKLMQQKHLLKIWFLALSLPFFSSMTLLAADLPDKSKISILTEKSDTFLQDYGDDAIREGSHSAIQGETADESIWHLITGKEKIENQADATQKTLALIKKIVNFALGFISLIALILLIVAGFKMTTANGDDKAFGAGKETLTTIVKAIGGIAVSRFLISGIFRFLEKIL